MVTIFAIEAPQCPADQIASEMRFSSYEHATLLRSNRDANDDDRFDCWSAY
jgi:hypothetical protein